MLTLEQLVLHVDELPALPDTALKVLRLVDDPNTSARDVCGALGVDVALTARVLKIANSAYYGMPRAIGTVSEAVLILGMRTVRNLAVAAAAYDVLHNEVPGYRLAAGELWRHSVACAIACDVLANRCGLVPPDEAFVAGLLHDVGKVVLSVHVAPQFQAIVALSELDDLPFHEAERSILGFDHAEVGGKVAEAWNLPGALCEAIGGHHDPARAEGMTPLVAVVHVSNWICVSEHEELGRSYGRVSCNAEALELVGLCETMVDDVRFEVHRRLESGRLVA